MQYLGPATMRDLAALRPLDARPGDRVFGISVSQVSRRIAAALGNGFSGHSPRGGLAQDLAASGAAMPALCVSAQSAGRGAVAKYYAESTSDSPETRL